MRKLAIIFFAILCACSLRAQATYDGLTIPNTHPRLMGFSNPTTLANARAWYTTHNTWVHSGWGAGCTVGNTSGGVACTWIAFQHLMTVTTGSVVDCTPAVNWVVDMMQNTINDGTFGVYSDNAENQYNNMMPYLIMVYDFCYDQFNSAQRTTVINGGNIAFGPYQGGNGGGTLPTSSYPNGYVGQGLENNMVLGDKMSGFLWALATYWEDTSIAQQNFDVFFRTQWNPFVAYVAKAMSGGGEGGVSNEDTTYGVFLFQHMLVPLLTAKEFGRDLFKESNYFAEMPYAILYATTPSPTSIPQFGTNKYDESGWGDAHTGCSCGDIFDDWWLSDFLTVLSNEYAGTNVAGYARTWLSNLSTQNPPAPWFASIDPGGSATSWSSLPTDYFAPGTGFFWIHNAWDTTSPLVKLGLNSNSESAGHPGQDATGNWEIWSGGRWLSRNTGGYANEFTGWNSGSTGVPIGDSYTADGNGILVNPDNKGCVAFQPNQTAGATCQGDGGLFWQENTVAGEAGNSQAYIPAAAIRLESQPTYAYAATDTTGAYYPGGYGAGIGTQGGLNNPAVGKVIRESVWLRDIKTLVTFDRILALDLNGVPAGNMTRTFLAHCEVNWTLVDANHATCSPDGTQLLRLTTLLPATPSPAYHVTDESTYAHTTDSQYRLEVNDTPGTAQSYFANVMQATTTSGTALTPTITDNGSSYTITLDANHSVTFVKGETSTGGSVTINGTTTNLATTVEPISVTTSGVTWNDPPLTVSIEPVDAGMASGTNCATGGYATNAPYSCTFTANSGYTFSSVTDTCGGTVSGNNDSGNVVSPGCQVVATFTQNATAANSYSSPLLLFR